MNTLSFHRIKSEHKAYPDTLIVIDSRGQCTILDPSLNGKAVIRYLENPKVLVTSYELWLTNSRVESAPYINALGEHLKAPIYAPFEFLTRYRLFRQHAKLLGLCGVYTPKIKSDLIQRLNMWNEDGIESYPLSQSYLIHFKSSHQLWFHPQFLNHEDTVLIDKIKNNIK